MAANPPQGLQISALHRRAFKVHNFQPFVTQKLWLRITIWQYIQFTHMYSHEISGYNMMRFMHLCPGPLPFYPTLPLSESALRFLWVCTCLFMTLSPLNMTYHERTCRSDEIDVTVKSKLATVAMFSYQQLWSFWKVSSHQIIQSWNDGAIGSQTPSLNGTRNRNLQSYSPEWGSGCRVAANWSYSK